MTGARPTDARDRADHDGLARLLRLAGHPTRLQILETLMGGVRCVKDINDQLAISQPNLSQHMGALRRAGLVASEKNGPLRCYYVLRPELVRQIMALRPERHPPEQRTREAVLRELEETRSDRDGRSTRHA